MALKDWRKERNDDTWYQWGKSKNIYEKIVVVDKDYLSKRFFIFIDDGKRKRTIYVKTKPQALAKAKSYMRSHK